MESLYNELAEVYEKMYYSFINYEEEYDFYSKILRQRNKKSVLEIGSGTGNLALQFVKNGYDYRGVDLSAEMISIAKRKLPDVEFIEGDMRNFKLDKKAESALITGRSISYLVTNDDVSNAFKSIHQNLEKGGVFCFDFIDANQFIPAILEKEAVTHKATFNDIEYVRKSTWKVNLKYGMDVVWDSIYYKTVENQLLEIGKDNAVVRTFTKEEIELFLILNQFKVLEIIKRASYFFPTYVVVAETC